MRFAVCVTFKIFPGHWVEFKRLMNENASTSLSSEEGCLQFDVCTDEDRPCELFLYEIYSSREAFQLHLGTDHFMRFDAQVTNMIEDKQVATYSEVG